MKLRLSPYIPLFTALFVVAHMLFLKSQELTALSYSYAFVASVIVSLPIFACVYFSKQAKGTKKALLLIIGFLLYPISILHPSDISATKLHQQFSTEEFVIFFIFYLLSTIHPVWQKVISSHTSLRIKSRITFSHAILLILIVSSLIFAFTFSAVPTISSTTQNSITINIESPMINVTHFFYYLYQFLVISMLIWGLYYLTRRWLVKDVLAKYGVYIFCCAVLIAVLVLTPILFSIILSLPMSRDELAAFIPSSNNIFYKNHYQVVLGLFVIFTPFILLFDKQQQEQQIQQLSEEKLSSELLQLQQQVNPHFLFNTLNNIYAHSLRGSDKTPKLISRLSNMLRYTVYDGQNKTVSLQEELQYLKDFIELQRLRAKDNLVLNIQIPERVDESLIIAPLLLIIVLENAFKHSIERTSEPCSIDIDLNVEGNELHLCCQNTFIHPPKNSLEKGGLGLDNLIKRLNLLYPKRHRLSYGQQQKEWRVALSITLNDE
ncbi:histidine kinase [Pseudoalteromonas sp. JBTF-M23]|uniref:Histidine kinase n=1 Tax=Pseudoalteromonas caenipelagi TaxID=2726988 RepID=A0A849VBU3_9GAMM|nr:histidine kinase [Pseudoalteromonas caenipelagi]NOU50495.1 histidine kinase [Pseudoalteromonas caenipelagi]